MKTRKKLVTVVTIATSPKSRGVSNRAKIIVEPSVKKNFAACAGIVLDAKATGNLIDDLPTPGVSAALIKDLTLKDAPKLVDRRRTSGKKPKR